MKKVSILGMTLLATIAIATVTFINSCTTDACKDVICKNAGTCVDGTCNCAAGYEGTDCGTESRAKFFGTWAGADACNTSGNFNYTATIATSSTGVTKVLVSNPFAVGTNVTVTADVDGSTITIPTGSTGNGYTFNGTGTLNSSHNQITFSYHIVDPLGSADDCTSTWTLQ